MKCCRERIFETQNLPPSFNPNKTIQMLRVRIASMRGTYILDYTVILFAWNPKQPFINGCFNWKIPNLYIGNGCFTKHPFINGCLGFQGIIIHNGC